jgi:tetratricopeptide (TPR) repeat protein
MIIKLLFNFRLLASIQFFLLATISNAQTPCACASFTPEVRARFEEANKMTKYEDAQIIIDGYKKLTDPCCRAIGYTMESLVANAKALSVESYKSAQTALAILKGRFHFFVSIECNRVLGVYYNKQGNSDSSIYFYYKALELAKDVDDPLLKSKIFTGISSVFSNQRQMSKGIEFAKKALLAAKAAPDSSLLAQSYSNLAIVYLYAYANTKQSEPYLDSAYQTVMIGMVYAKSTGVPVNIIKNYISLAAIAEKRHRYQESLLYSDTLLTLINEKTNANVLTNIYMGRASAYVGLNAHIKAVEWLQKALANALKVRNLFLEKEMHGKLYTAYKASGETTLALQSLEQYKVLSDSLVTKQNAEVISEMDQKYNKVENELTIKELALEKRIYILLSVTSFLAILVIAFFVRHQSLKHKKKILETEQRLNRARMNPHFFFNALTSLQQHALRQSDGTAMASRLSQFSEVMRKTLESTYQDYITIEEEVAYLHQYLDIQKNRYPVSFSFTVSYGDDLEINEVLIPPMIVQPFIENSIEHGLAGIDWLGKIDVRFEMRADELYVEIADNGKGLGDEKREKNEHISRATEIIKDRIYLLATKMKSKARFSVGNKPNGKGVLVAIYLPLIYKQEVTQVAVK